MSDIKHLPPCPKELVKFHVILKWAPTSFFPPESSSPSPYQKAIAPYDIIESRRGNGRFVLWPPDLDCEAQDIKIQ